MLEWRCVLGRLTADQRVGMKHLALMTALFSRWMEGGFKKAIPVTRKVLMRQSKIRSIVTYHQVVKDLQDFGYIIYCPSYNPFKGSTMELVPMQGRRINEPAVISRDLR